MEFFPGMAARNLFFSLLGAASLAGCATQPAHALLPSDGSVETCKAVMGQQDKIVHLSPAPTYPGKPILLLLHGATDDPTEMMPIVREWRQKYDVFLYSYNYHQRIEKVASDLVGEIRRLKAENPLGGPMTALVYSYSAIVFRESVILADDPALFAGVSLVQLVPTAGGSHLAKTMEFPPAAWLASLASHPSAAENPYGVFARQIWEGAGNKKFYEAIPAQRIQTLILQGDSHSLANVDNPEVRLRYNNGIGPNVIVIPASSGTTHDYLPNDPVALQYLRTVLDLPGNVARLSNVTPNTLAPTSQKPAVR
jgi:hypothetical protein